MDQYTPGPWHSSVNGIGVVKIEALGFDTFDGSAVVATSGSQHLSFEVQKANARLMAAAPELLAGGTAQTEILKKAQDILTSYLIPDGIDGAAAIDQLLGLLDGPEQRAAKSLWIAATSKALPA